jgi:hypothetical protein
MYGSRRIPPSTPRTAAPEIRRRPGDEAGEITSACRQACREVEAARLVLAELGRRHGPVD